MGHIGVDTKSVGLSTKSWAELCEKSSSSWALGSGDGEMFLHVVCSYTGGFPNNLSCFNMHVKNEAEVVNNNLSSMPLLQSPEL